MRTSIEFLDITGLKADYYTIAASNPGTPTAIGAAGADRVRTTISWHINAADAAWQKTLLDYAVRYKSISHLDSLFAIRPVQIVAAAMNKAGSLDPMKVAFALEGMTYAGPNGTSWMRAEDHQMLAPISIVRFTKAVQPDVKYDEEGTGYGWKTEVFIEAKFVNEGATLADGDMRTRALLGAGLGRGGRELVVQVNHRRVCHGPRVE